MQHSLYWHVTTQLLVALANALNKILYYVLYRPRNDLLCVKLRLRLCYVLYDVNFRMLDADK